MRVLRLVRASFAYRPDHPVLIDVDLHLEPGFTAVVGPNGAGKSTLLALLSQDLTPDRGAREGPDDVARCPQEVEALDDTVRAFAWGWTGERSWALQSRLDLDPAHLERWPTLSPGERKRWQLGAALAAEPDVLLLDEPTNHLDAPTRALVLEALATYEGVGVVVSHDRALLRVLPRAVVRVERGRTTYFAGPWEQAVAQWTREREALHKQVDEADRRAKTARRHLADARRAAAQADAQISVRARARGVHDSDARTAGARTRVEKGAARASRQAALARRRTEVATTARHDLDPRDVLGRDVQFAARPSRRRLLACQIPVLKAGDRVLLRDVDLWLDQGEKVWLRGANGAGKSTLVSALLAACTLPDGAALVLPQHVDGHAVLARVRALPPDERGAVLTAVAALGVDPAALLRTSEPSPGEARKLRIAEGLGTGAALLVLDEPSNHMDLPSVERLQAALQAYNGAVLLVTHDADLGAAVAQTVWALENQRVVWMVP